MPLEVELHRNYRHSIMGQKLFKLLDDHAELAIWYARAQRLVEEEMQKIANNADEDGQVDSTILKDDALEMLSLYMDNQEKWQEVCLLVEKEDVIGDARVLVINRPMAGKLTENLGKLVLFGVDRPKDLTFAARKDLLRFMIAFGPECALYVGGPEDQDQPATVIHGIPGLPGAREISPGSRIYEGGLDAAVQGVLDGKYKPLDFRFFVGCQLYEEFGLDVAVHLGKYQPVACARSLALKQCIALPKPLWHEGMVLILPGLLLGTVLDDPWMLMTCVLLPHFLSFQFSSYGIMWRRNGRYLKL